VNGISGLIYIVFGLVMMKYQDKLLKYIPTWLLSTVVIMIALMLLPIGSLMISSNILVGLVAMLVASLLNLIGGNKLKMFSIPIAILASFVVALITKSIDFTILNQQMSYEFLTPKFNLESFTLIGLIGLPVIAELLGDVRNTGSCMGKNLFKEVGIGRIAIGNGLGSLISGLFGGLPSTSYSENNGYLLYSKYTNPTAQVFTGIFFIVISLFTPFLKVILLIPGATLGGIALYLYSMILINSMKDVFDTVSISRDKKKITIITLMIALFFVEFIIGSISISSIAVATIIGIILNAIIPERN